MESHSSELFYELTTLENTDYEFEMFSVIK